MRSDLTDITVVMDRSGSMSSIKDEAENGLNSFIEEQKKLPGDATFTLVEFDTEYNFVHNGVPLKDVPKCKLVPRGMTALLDAVGRAVNETGDRLSKMPEDQRPGLVVFVIITDGQENASHEFTRKQIKEMIEHQTNVYNWKFTFLGANQDAFAEAASIGISAQAAANFAAKNADVAYKSAHKNLMRMRSQSMSGEQVSCSYSQDERSQMSQ